MQGNRRRGLNKHCSNAPMLKMMPLRCAKNFVVSFILPCGVLLAALTTAHAQYQIQSWTTDEGLPQNTVHSIVQTPDGYMWLATLDGLVRFDGVRFTVFNKQNTKGIESNRFTQIVVDAHGDLWIGVEKGDVTRYHNGGFQTFKLPNDPTRAPLWNLNLDGDGEVVLFNGLGMFRWDGEKFAPRAPVAGETRDSRVWWSKSGAFWYANGQTVHRFKDNRVTDFRLPGTSDAALVNKILEDSRGRLWIGTQRAGLFMLENEKLIAYSISNELPSNIVSPRIEDRNGNLWVVTNNGAVIIAPDGRVSRLSVEQGLSDNALAPVFALSSIYEDREGDIWIGTLYHGFNRVSRRSVFFYSVKDGLAANVAHPIYEDREGGVWVGGKGLTRRQAGRFSRIADGEEFAKGITAIHQDRRGRMWFGVWNGVYYSDDSKFTEFTKFADESGLRSTVTDIHEDRAGGLWFASDAGLFRWHNERLTHLTTNDGLPSNDVKVIHEATDGTLWIGTYGGLVKLSEPPAVAGDLSHVEDRPLPQAVLTVADGLASNLVRSIYEDREGVLWIGSYDGGLTRLKDNRFTRYTTADGLFNDGVFQILEDERGWLWMSCNRGVYRVAKDELNGFADGKLSRITSIALGKTDGLLETECNGGQQPAGISARDGMLWFPTQGGVAVIDPRNIPFNSHPPPIVIETVKVDNEFLTNSAHAIRNSQSAVEIAPGKNNLEIAYTGLSFIKPEFVKFRYKLEGLDSDWIEAGNRRTAYYSYLPAGDYVFTVIAANADGVWNTEGAHVRVKVLPPFYRTWWFSFFSLGLVVGAAVLFYRRRVAQLEREKAAQQAYSQQLIGSQESERKRIAAELHDGLGQSLVVIKNRALISLSEPDNHDRLRAQMEEISEASTAAIAEVRGIARNLHPYQIEYLGLTTALATMVEGIAEATKIKITSTIDPLDGQLSKEAEVNLYRIVQETLNNVVKHSAANNVRVSLKRNEHSLDLIVADDGKGFSFDHASYKPGLGLTGIAERAKMLKGHYEIHSSQGEGTRIFLQIPM